jgi:hypothetical protein
VRRARRALALLVVALAATSAFADVVHLKDGGTIEGKVVAEDKTQVTIDTRFGRQTIERSRIDRIEKGKTPQEEIAEREAALAKGGTAQQWFELAEFAGSKGLKKERERLLDKALAVDPDHEAANRAKGRVKHEGRWMTPAERDAAVKAAEEAQMRERGLVPFEGRWVTAEEKAHLEHGEVLVNGKWLGPDDAKRAQGFTKLGDEWILQSEEVPLRRARGFAAESKLPLETSAGDHVVAATTFGKEHLDPLRDACELGYVAAAKSFHESDSDLTWLGGQKVLVVVLPAREEFGAFCRFFAHDEKKVDQRWAEGVAQADGFFWWDPSGTSATFKGSRGLDDTIAHSVHHLGHVLLNRHGFNFKFLPTWLDEGYAAWLEHEVLKRNVISCISSRRYGADGVRKDELVSRTSWYEDSVKQIAEGADPPLSPLLRKDLTTITPDEVAKSMVLIDWLVRERPDAFLQFLTALRQAWPKGVASPLSPEARTAHAKAFDALGTPADLLDRELRAAIAKRPKPQPEKKAEGR